MLPYLIWKGKRSTAMKVVVNEYPPITKPKARVTHLTIPGRSGTLTVMEGDKEVYESYLRPVEMTLLPGADVEAVCNWLTGSGQAVFGNEANRAYEARIINQIDFVKILRGRAHKRFTVPFYCQPYKQLYPAASDISVTTSNTKLTNPGTAEAEPVITVYGSGDISLTVGFNTVLLEDVVSAIVIDCQLKDCMSLDKGTLLNYKMSGEFPTLAVGQNAIIWKGTVSRVKITPNWRYL